MRIQGTGVCYLWGSGATGGPIGHSLIPATQEKETESKILLENCESISDSFFQLLTIRW